MYCYAEVLRRLAEDIAADGGELSVRAKFESLLRRRHGANESGVEGLDAFQLVDMIRGLFSRITHAEVRFLVASLRSIDLDGDGLISLPELKRALRLATVRRVIPGEGFSRGGSSQRHGGGERSTGGGYGTKGGGRGAGNDSARSTSGYGGKSGATPDGDSVRCEMDKSSGASRHIDRTKSRDGYQARRPGAGATTTTGGRESKRSSSAARARSRSNSRSPSPQPRHGSSSARDRPTDRGRGGGAGEERRERGRSAEARGERPRTAHGSRPATTTTTSSAQWGGAR